MHQAVTSRDAQIRDLRETLARRIVAEPTEGLATEIAALRGLAADLEHRLARDTQRRAALEDRLAAARVMLVHERSTRMAAEHDRDIIHQELDAIEASLAHADPGPPATARQAVRLDGVRLLYVGGRPNQIAQIRAAVARLGADFLHHDGGVENHPTLLPGLASRSDIVLFPVDCISHDAANAIKALCLQNGKHFVPLRSASVTSLLAALHTPELIGLPGATG